MSYDLDLTARPDVKICLDDMLARIEPIVTASGIPNSYAAGYSLACYVDTSPLFADLLQTYSVETLKLALQAMYYARDHEDDPWNTRMDADGTIHPVPIEAP